MGLWSEEWSKREVAEDWIDPRPEETKKSSKFGRRGMARNKIEVMVIEDTVEEAATRIGHAIAPARFVGGTVNSRHGQRKWEGFNSNGDGLEGFSTDRKKEIMGEFLTSKESSITMGRVVRVVCPPP